MAPYIDSDALKVPPLDALDTATELVTADALQTLKAVQDLIDTYFAKNALPGMGSVLTPESLASPPSGLVEKETQQAPSLADAKAPAPDVAQPPEVLKVPGAGGPMPGPKILNPERLRSLAADISSSIDKLASSSGPEADVARLKASAAVLELGNSLRPPPEVILNWFGSASIVSAVRVFQEWGVFDAIPALTPGGSGPQGISFSDLASKVEAEESLLIRLSWMLTSTSVLLHLPETATSPARLAHTPVSMLLRAGQPMGAMFKVMFTNVVEVSTILPSYFSTYGRREPLGPAHIPTSFLAGQPHLEYFEHLNQDPARIANFMLAMGITHRTVPTTGMYDMAPVLAAAAADPARTIWVDIGGGDGHTVKLFRRAYALPAHQCLIQDLPEVVAAAESTAATDPDLAGVRFIPMDFHRDAPVKGARVYYLRHIVRDYSDPTVAKILRNVARGLTQPDSRILVAEQLTTTPPPMYAAFKDYSMLAIGGKERSLEGFKGVAEAAGLVVCGVWRDKGTPHAVVEMKLKEGRD